MLAQINLLYQFGSECVVYAMFIPSRRFFLVPFLIYFVYLVTFLLLQFRSRQQAIKPCEANHCIRSECGGIEEVLLTVKFS